MGRMSEQKPVWTAADFEKDIAELSTLTPGWADGRPDGSGAPISIEAIATMRIVLSLLQASGIAKPILYPTHDGGTQCKWPDLFGEIKACANGTIEAWADLEPEALPSRDETIWEARGPATTAAAIVAAFVSVAALVPPAKDAHGALIREVKAHPNAWQDTDEMLYTGF